MAGFWSSLGRRGGNHGWQRVAPFRGLNQKELKYLSQQLQRRAVSAGTRVAEEGEPANELILVESGELQLLKLDRTSRSELPLGVTRSGQVLGEHALLDGKPRAVSARALVNSTLLILPFEPLRRQAARRNNSIERHVYDNLMVGLAASLADRAREHVDQSLMHARQRAMMGQFIVNVLILVCSYVLFLNALPLFWGRVSNTTETFSLPLIAVFGWFSWRFIRKSGYPLSHFGIGFRYLLGSLVEAIVFTLPFLGVITGMKAIVLWAFDSSLPVVEHTDLVTRMSESNVLLWLRIYAATAVVQELIVRGVLQSSLEAFLTGPGRRTRAIVVCALLFAISHLHISYLFALLALVPGVFWGWLYSRRPNLVGVSVSHVAVGAYVFFVLGVKV